MSGVELLGVEMSGVEMSNPQYTVTGELKLYVRSSLHSKLRGQISKMVGSNNEKDSL